MDVAPPTYCTRCGAPAALPDRYCASCGTPIVGRFGPYPGAYVLLPRPARPQGSPLVPAPDPVTGVTLAGWRARAMAYVLDFFIVMIPLTGLCIGTGIALSRTVHRPNGTQLTGDSGLGAVVIIVEVLVVSIGYFAVCNGVWGATLGMRPFRIGVRAIDGHGLIGPLRAGLRFAILYLFLLVAFAGAGLVLIALDLLSPLWDRRRQAWHDRMAGSLVVTLPAGSSRSPS